jgi:hypothetical protein
MFEGLDFGVILTEIKSFGTVAMKPMVMVLAFRKGFGFFKGIIKGL